MNIINIEDPVLEERVVEKARRATQWQKTFSGSHAWRRNESSAWRFKDTADRHPDGYSLRSLRLPYSEGESRGLIKLTEEDTQQLELPLSVLFGIDLSTYFSFQSRFRADAQAVLNEYSREDALRIQDVLDRDKLYLPNMMNVGFFVRGPRYELYFLDHKVESALEKEGLEPHQISEFEKIGELERHISSKSGITYITLPQNKSFTMRLVPEGIRRPFLAPQSDPPGGRLSEADSLNALLAGYRDNPLGAHAFEHAASRRDA